MTDHARALDELLTSMRPHLHRYCARMVGSTVDGEDIVQDAALKAVGAWQDSCPPQNPRGCLFRIAHNAALDFLRRRHRTPEMQNEAALADAAMPDAPDPDLATTSLTTFMRLPALQRSAVVLKDVLGHSLDEVAAITGTSEPAAKSALQRGRVRLRALATEPQDRSPPMLPEATRARLLAYVEGFRTGDFDAVRAMLADDVRLDLVGKLARQGSGEVGEYYHRYAATDRWTFAAGIVEGRPAMLVHDRDLPSATPAYFVALAFDGDRVRSIHDFLFARYALEGVDLRPLDVGTGQDRLGSRTS